MNGVQDMGGMQASARSSRSRTSRCSTPLGKRAFALTLAMGAPGGWNIDMSRFARESLPPREYLAHDLLPDLARRRCEKLMVERGLRRAPTRSRPAMPHRAAEAAAARHAHGEDVAKVLYRGAADRARTDTGAALCGRRPRAREEHASRRPHAPAALRARA